MPTPLRLRLLAPLAMGLAVAVSAALPAASAAEPHWCWTPPETENPAESPLFPLHCRVGDAAAAVYDSRADVPVALYPNLGEDLAGRCWYHRSVASTLEVASLAGDGSAELIDFGTGGPALSIGILRRCRSEVAVGTAATAVWRYLRGHEFAEPYAELVPRRGITGLPTYLVLEIPEAVAVGVVDAESRSSIAVTIEVAEVMVDWGDGTRAVRFDAGMLRRSEVEGPGTVAHSFESASYWRVEVAYSWNVRWQTPAGAWRPVAVVGTERAAWYGVDEIIARIVG